MQIPEMKALRSLYTHTNLSILKPTKILFPRHRQFHSTASRFCGGGSVSALDSSTPDSDSANTGNAQPARQLWSIYGPIISRIDTQVSIKNSDDQDFEPGSSNLPNEVEDFGGKMNTLPERVKDIEDLMEENSGLKSENLSDRDKTRRTIPRYSNENQDFDRKMRSLSEEMKEINDLVDEDGYRDNTRVGLVRCSNENEESANEKRYRCVKKAGLVTEVGTGHFVGNIRRKGKTKTFYVCEYCGYEDGQWWGICRECNKAGTMKRFLEKDIGSGGTQVSGSGIEVSEISVRSWLPQKGGETQPLRLSEVNQGMNQLDWRIPLPGLFGSEVARVLGGGLIPGSLVLVGGDPGVGKSTLLLQIAALISEGRDQGKPAPVVYVSGEESVEQIVNRADRVRIGVDELYLYSSTDIEDILKKIQPLSPRALIVDSIQTVYIQGVTGSAGGLSQVKECTSALLRFAKKTKIPVLLIGHVTKSGDIAGPRVLEHIVDVVLYLEGEKHSTHRLLRPVKNRFGSTDELGVFEMSQSGLKAVLNPSEIFLSEQYASSEILVGLAIAVIMDGSRSFLIEIQALCVSASDSSVSRHVNGIQGSRADMIISVLNKQAGLKLHNYGVFLNVVSGVTLTETAGDLAIAAAICSSFMEFPIPNDVAFIGEIGLGGELRTVPRMEKRVNTVAKLGYRMCIVPKSAEKSLSNLGFEGIKIACCANLKEVIDTVFRKQK